MAVTTTHGGNGTSGNAGGAAGATGGGSGPLGEVIESLSPATGEILGTVPVMAAEEVDAAVARARQAAGTWGAMSAAERRAELASWRRALAARADDIAELIHRENGKPRVDAMLELYLALSHLHHAGNRADKALRTRRVPSGLMANLRATISYQPLGVIAVIGPWNYPLFTPMGSIAYALAAGNAVVFKPSEHTPLIGQLIGEIAREAISLPHVFQVVTGDGRTGGALARSAVDKIAFTGSAATGRKVMMAAAERLTPVLMELGGKDPMVVAEDADLDKAAEAAVYGALTNAGQACVSIERCYVVDSVYQPFLDRVVAEARQVRWGADDEAHIGAITMPRQVETIREHMEEALARGARAVVGGPEGIRGNFVPPTVLVDVTPDMKIMREETFGPVLPIARVRSVEEALAQANATTYGLASAVFGKSGVRELADRIRAGSTAINSVVSFVGVPSLPFGGLGESGFGRIHGDEGLREFCHVKATAEERFSLPINLASFKLPRGSYERVRGMIHHLFGGGAIDRLRDTLRL
ncbi:MAG TPA: aldehyde dehydrogenase family protein [Kofleriaceae bacterium]|nr:aldehyde dehydrogenase family protein [Kofleriaceae bacterium]